MKVRLLEAEEVSDKDFLIYLNEFFTGRFSHTPINVYLSGLLVGRAMATVFKAGEYIDIVIDTDIPEYFSIYKLTFYIEEGTEKPVFELGPREVFSATGLRISDIRNTKICTEIRGR